MGGEGCAAMANDTGLSDSFHDLFRGHGVDVQRLDGGVDFVLEIVFDYNGQNVAAVGVGLGCDFYDSTGHGSVNRRGNGCLCFGDLLTKINMVTHVHDRRAGCADVHGHRNHHTGRCGQKLDCLSAGGSFHIIGVDTAFESMCHSFTSLINYHIQYYYRTTM